jgi:oxygen-dependent protoporphyrinogen oxidase
MRHQLPEDILVTLLRQCYFAPRCRSAVERPSVYLHHHIRSLGTSTRQAKQYGMSSEVAGIKVRDSRPGTLEDSFVFSQSTSPTPPETTNTPKYAPENIAILGGGISGLASAHYLSKYLPNTNIILYEASDRMGGWLQSKYVNIGNGKIVFEQGPRNIRPRTPAGLVTLELVINPELGTSQLMLMPLCRSRQLASKTK